MLISLRDGSTGFRLLPAVRYGTVPGLPSEQAALYLDLLLPDAPADRPAPVVIYPILTGLFGAALAERGDLIRQASPLHHLRPGISLPPFLLVHGSHDERSPVEQAQVLVHALRVHGADATIHLVQGGHHNMREDPTLPWSDEPWTALGREALAFFTKHLG